MGRKKSTSTEVEFTQWVSTITGKPFHTFSPDEAWRPAVNCYEDDANFHVVAELAGVGPDDVELIVCGDVIRLRGSRPLPRVELPKGEIRAHSMEIDHGSFCRNIHIPEGAQADAISAEFTHGMLWIRLPKAKGGK
jgi:HSP20 family protein